MQFRKWSSAVKSSDLLGHGGDFEGDASLSAAAAIAQPGAAAANLSAASSSNVKVRSRGRVGKRRKIEAMINQELYDSTSSVGQSLADAELDAIPDLPADDFPGIEETPPNFLPRVIKESTTVFYAYGGTSQRMDALNFEETLRTLQPSNIILYDPILETVRQVNMCSFDRKLQWPVVMGLFWFFTLFYLWLKAARHMWDCP